jgi:hypothetical protein
MPITMGKTDSMKSAGEAIELCIKQRESGIKNNSLSKFHIKGYKIKGINSSRI